MEASMKKVMVTGGNGFLGGFVCEKLKAKGYDVWVPAHKDYDLRDYRQIISAFVYYEPEIVIHLAAVAGGIKLNMERPASLFYDNITMGVEMLHEAYKCDVEKFVAVNTTCAYPSETPVPFNENDLWNGYPEKTNAPYAIAKKVILIQSQAYRDQYKFNSINLIPGNMYGPRDSFNLDHSHVIPALIKKFIDAKDQDVTAWGTGIATREFLYVEDCADGIILAMENYNSSAPVNLGTGTSITMKELVEKIAAITEFKGNIIWDTTKPDGQLKRQLDVSKAKEYFGFEAKTTLDEGLQKTIDWYRTGLANENRK
jgi:GDP-L-fucose synthase